MMKYANIKETYQPIEKHIPTSITIGSAKNQIN